MSTASAPLQVRTDLALLLALAPIIWALGVSLVAYHLVVAALFVRTLWQHRGHGVRVPPTAWLLVLLGIHLCVAAILNATGRVDRLVPAIYNASFWFFGAMIVVIIVNGRSGSFAGLQRLALIAQLLLVALAPLCLLLTLATDETIVAPSLAGIALDREGLPTLVRDSMQLKVLSPDWIGGEQSVRVTLLAPYPTAVAGLALGLLAFAHLRTPAGSAPGLLLSALALLLCVLSASRVGIGALLVYLLALTWFALPINPLQKLALLILGLMVVIVGLVASGALAAAIAWSLDVRGGSTALRFLLYQESISALLDGNPLIGRGVKVRGFTGTVPLGSHSTYVGLLYRGGLVAGMLLALLGVAVLQALRQLPRAQLPWLRRRADTITASVIAFAAFFALEDVDAPQLVSFVFFTTLGIAHLGRAPTLARPAAQFRTATA